MLAIDLERRTATFAGLGNISGVVLHPTGARHSMVSHNGTAGHTAARIQEFHYPVPAGPSSCCSPTAWPRTGTWRPIRVCTQRSASV